MKTLYFPEGYFWNKKYMRFNKPYSGIWLVWTEDGYFKIEDFGDLTTA